MDARPRKSLAVGLGSVTLADIVVRLMSLASQVVLGWLLMPSDFGVYALAVGISTTAKALRNGGVAQTIMARPEDYTADPHRYFRFALVFNVLAALALVVIALSVYRSRLQLAWILAGIALSFVIGTEASILRSKLTVDRRYREVNVISIAGAVAGQSTVCLLALMGCGALSFAMLPVAQATAETILTRRYAGAISVNARRSNTDYRSLFRDARWVMLGAGALGLATTGDYLAVGMIASLATTGAYFFAFQLAAALGTPISTAIDVVMPPGMAQASNDEGQRQRLFHAVLSGVLLGGIPAAVICAIMAPSLVEFVWHGRWSSASVAIQLLTLAIPSWLVFTVCRAALTSNGMWRARFALITAYGVGGLSTAAASAVTNQINVIAASVTAFYALFAVTMILLTCRLARWRSRESLAMLLLTIAVNAAALTAASAAGHWGDTRKLAGGILTVCVYVLGVAVGSVLLQRSEWASLWQVLAGVVKTMRPGRAPRD